LLKVFLSQVRFFEDSSLVSAIENDHPNLAAKHAQFWIHLDKHAQSAGQELVAMLAAVLIALLSSRNYDLCQSSLHNLTTLMHNQIIDKSIILCPEIMLFFTKVASNKYPSVFSAMANCLNALISKSQPNKLILLQKYKPFLYHSINYSQMFSKAIHSVDSTYSRNNL
jgi:hypothetical protein